MLGDIQTNLITLGLIPHGHCYLWKPGLVWLHVWADASIALAYFSIPVALIYFTRQRQDLPYPWVFQLFGAFIVTCGLTHLMEIWTLWNPIYWVSGILKAVTAAISIATALALFPVIPQALVLPSRSELEQNKAELEQRVQDRTKALQLSEERLQMALAGSGDGFWDWDITTDELFLSPRWAEMLGYEAGELPSHINTWKNLVHPDDQPGVLERLTLHLQDETQPYVYDHRLKTKAGNWRWIATYGQVVSRDPQGQPMRMSGTHKDISNRKAYEQKLSDSLAEKNVMLQEIHHRVKNNLQVICSLLNLQTQSNDPLIAEIMKESQNRVKSMALVHENLYQSESLSHISLDSYVQELAHNLLRSYRSRVSLTQIKVAIADIHLDIDTAVPCGLIINELVSNALKYAFPPDQQGEITIHIHEQTDHTLALTIADNGIGLPTEIEVEHTNTLGLRMVKTLTRQIAGTLTVNRKIGTSFQIQFPQPSH